VPTVLVVHNRYRSAQPSGENAVVDTEIRLLRQSGVDVRVLEANSDHIARFSAPRRAQVPIDVVWSRRGRAAMQRALHVYAPDVVHVHNTFPLLSPSVLWAARAVGVPVVHTLHNFRPLCANGIFFRDGSPCELCLRRGATSALRHGCYRGSRLATVPLAAMSTAHRVLQTWQTCVDAFIVPSDFARTKYVQAGWPADRFHVRYNTAPEPAQVRDGAGDGFLFIGRLSEEKGLSVLLEAWSQAFPDGGPGLSIIGGGDLERDVRASASGLAGVEVLGQLPLAEAMRRLASARALVFPSLSYELFPRTIAEAFARGVPVIASRLGSVPEIVADGEVGALFRPRSAAELAGRLVELAASPAVARRLGEAARRRYEASLSPAAATASLLEIYDVARAGRARGGMTA
jgi:glycosyltransferase involved in cell wall biosynthesis